MVWSLLELHSAIICASAPAVKGSVLVALNWILKKLGRREKPVLFGDDDYKGYPKDDLEKKGGISVEVKTVHKYEF